MGRASSSSSNRRIGILGGTFDPVHLGHLIIAQEAALQLGLERVLFVPAGNPWQKAARRVTPAAHRINMVKLAIRSNPLFRLSRIEIEQPGPSYSADTVEILKRRLGKATELYFIIGTGSLAELPTWKDPERLVRSCWLAVCRRPGYPDPDLKALEKAIPGIARRIVFLDTPLIGISSSDIRRRVAERKPIRYLVTTNVERYILANCVYGC